MTRPTSHTDNREQAIYECGRLAGLREERANAPRWLGSIPHKWPTDLETMFVERIAYPSRRLWRRVIGRPEYDD